MENLKYLKVPRKAFTWNFGKTTLDGTSRINIEKQIVFACVSMRCENDENAFDSGNS